MNRNPAEVFYSPTVYKTLNSYNVDQAKVIIFK